MKIVIATPLYPPELGVPAAYVQDLAERLSHEHQVTIVAFATTFELVGRAKLVAVSKKYPLPVRMLVYAARLFSAAAGADVIYVQRALASGLPAAVVGWLRRVPVVVNFVDDEVGDSSQLRSKIQRYVLRRAAKVIVPSDYVASRCSKMYSVPSDKIYACPTPQLPDEKFPFEAERKPRTVLAHTGAEVAIRALPALLQIFPDAELVVLGQVSTQVKKLANEAGVASSVVFLGRVSRAEEWYSYRQASVYVADLQSEKGDYHLRSAFRGGAAVLDSASQDLAEAIAGLLSDEATRQVVVAAGQADAEQRGSWHAHLALLKTLGV